MRIDLSVREEEEEDDDDDEEEEEDDDDDTVSLTGSNSLIEGSNGGTDENPSLPVNGLIGLVMNELLI